jgi:hypothetical protein
MARTRNYTVECAKVAATVKQDVLAVYAGASMSFEVQGWSIAQDNISAFDNLAYRIVLLPATVTAGSGGSTPSAQPVLPSDAAATVTAHANDTTQATTGGTARVLYSGAVNIQNGELVLLPPDLRFVCAPSQAIVLSLDDAPANSTTISATMFIGEQH